MRRFSLRTILLCTVLVSLLTACGGGGSAPVTLPSRTGTGLPSRTATGVPTPDRSTPTVPPTGQPTNQPTNQPTDRPTNQPTNQPTNRPTNQPTNQPTTQATIQPTTQATIQPSTGGTSAPPSASSSPEPAESDQDQGSDDISPWWWVALAVVLLGGAVVAWLLIRRSRRRRAWLADLAAAEAEVGWFARDLVPQLRGSGSVEGVAGGWTVAAPRVTALDDRLTELVTTAPGTEERARAATFQDAVRAAREGVAGLVAAGGTDTWSLDLDAAQAPLLAALVPPASASQQGPGSPPGH